MKFVNTFALMCLAFAYSNAMKDIPSKELVKDIKIGWNLGNTLDAHCLDTLDYSKNGLDSETCWGNPKATPELFQKLHQLGFNIFRIPTTWTGHFGEGPDYKIDDAWMKRVHEVVDYALNTGSYAILNIHHENWNYAFSKNLESAREIIAALWKQIAAEFESYDEHLIFEGQNEPRKNGDPVEWTGGDQEGWDFVNELDNIFYETVRASGGNNTKRHLMVPPYAAGAYGGAPEHLKYPENDDKIIVSIHAYSPYSFCLDTSEDAATEFTDASEIDGTMASISENFLSKGVPVIMGEFGAMNRHNDDERKKWAEYYIKSYKSIGVPCILWDNGIFEGDGERFAIIDRTQLKVAYPKLVTGLMNGLGDYDYQIPESDILEQVDVEEPTATEPETPVSTVAEPVEPVPTVTDATLPPKTIDTLPAKTPEAALPNPSEAPALPPKTIDTLPVKTPEAALPNPSEAPALPPKTIDTLPVKTPEAALPNPSEAPALPPKTIDTLPAKTPEAALPNPSEAPALPPKTIDTLPAKTPEADLPNPSEAPALPPKTIDTLPAKTPEPITPPEQNQTANDGDLSYFSCEKDDWKCKSEKSDLCFKEASDCWASGKDAETCTNLGNECNKIWS
eukprot:jgi/Orpsp1_1/1179846/evm.model.c7180000071049.1